eukprot:8205834-Ditylum_brightwellii.AAC.1
MPTYYYFTNDIQQKQWRPPPACSWVIHFASMPLPGSGCTALIRNRIRLQIVDQSLGNQQNWHFTNLLTGQATWKMPDALKWRLSRTADMQPFWYNFANNHAQ